jgi:RHS repeat-associated protein
MTTMNNPADLVADKDFFGMALDYDKIGNIKTWDYQYTQQNTTSRQYENKGLYSYAFTYDNLNRLLTSDLSKAGANMFSNQQNYDANGNILNLQRKFNGTVVDNMEYTYPKINQLERIKDTGTNPADGSGEFFKDGIADYVYDKNGNLISDSGKGITSISYNYMNLVNTVVQNGKSLIYTYASNGQKVGANLGTLKKYDYFSMGVWKNDTLEFIPTPEGRITKDPSTKAFKYEYILKDHLGNARLSCACQTKLNQTPILQENHYDAWGLGLPFGVDGSLRFTYNSKEKQEGTGWLDYGARMYDPQKVTWNGVDALSEKGRRWSPYVFSFDNSLRFIDPDGMWPGEGYWNATKDWIKNKIQWNSLNSAEKAYSKEHPVDAFAASVNWGQAVSMELKLHKYNSVLKNQETGQDDGVQNAVKHTFWSAKNTQTLGDETAQKIGDTHEGQDLSESSKMDRKNNSVGIEIGKNISIQTENSEILSLVLDAGKQGKLSIISIDGNGNKITTQAKLTNSQINAIQKVINQLSNEEIRNSQSLQD